MNGLAQLSGLQGTGELHQPVQWAQYLTLHDALKTQCIKHQQQDQQSNTQPGALQHLLALVAGVVMSKQPALLLSPQLEGAELNRLQAIEMSAILKKLKLLPVQR